MAAGHRLSERFSAPAEAVPLRRRGRRRTRPAPRTTRITVVIVNFCQWRNTYELVEQLRQSDNFREGRAEVVVADNHSPDHPLRDQLRETEGVTVRPFARNLGFARAVNEACRVAEGEWVLLLNPDMRVGDGFLDDVEAEIRRIDRELPTAGVVGFRLRHGDGSRQASCGPFPTLLRTITGLLVPRARRKCKLSPARKPTAVSWVTGCCLLARRDCLRELGGFDEDYFLYYEDVDFCRRARLAGWTVHYDPRVEVTHYHPLHTRRVPAPLRLMTRHALLMYGIKHWPRWQAMMVAALIWIEARGRAYRRPDEPAHGDLGNLVGRFLRGDAVGMGDLIRRNAARLGELARSGEL